MVQSSRKRESALKNALVYGLGSLTRRFSRYQVTKSILSIHDLPQFVFFVEILTLFPEMKIKEAFDPQFSTEDCIFLEKHGFCVLKENELCERRLETPSLVFMPHLEVRIFSS